MQYHLFGSIATGGNALDQFQVIKSGRIYLACFAVGLVGSTTDSPLLTLAVETVPTLQFGTAGSQGTIAGIRAGSGAILGETQDCSVNLVVPCDQLVQAGQLIYLNVDNTDFTGYADILIYIR